MKSPAVFFGLIVIGILAIAAGATYLIPSVYHPLATQGFMHLKHASVGIVVGLVCIGIAIYTRRTAQA